MHRKVLLCGSVILILFILSIAYVNGEDATVATTRADSSCEDGDCEMGTTVEEVSNFRIIFSYTHTAKYDNKRRRPGYGKNRDNNYDIMDENVRSPLDSLNVWIAYGNGWILDDKSRYRGQGHGNYRNNADYSEEKDYEETSDDDDDSKKENYSKQRLYARIRFPVRHYRNYRQFPIKRFPPLVSIAPWLPIFYDKVTYQTIIFSPTGGIYILPPLINFYGQRFAVAQLIKWGYASLVSTGASPPPNVDVAPLIQQPPVTPVNAGGAVPSTPGLAFDEKRVQFTDAVKTNFLYIKPDYGQTLVEGGYDTYEPTYDKNYGSHSNYDTTNKQQVYAQD
ncbi:unnamed protein product [Rotaria sp. Silwood1]|nr:unnamed protein product [Rotaria sp. Silwood1]